MQGTCQTGQQHQRNDGVCCAYHHQMMSRRNRATLRGQILPHTETRITEHALNMHLRTAVSCGPGQLKRTFFFCHSMPKISRKQTQLIKPKCSETCFWSGKSHGSFVSPCARVGIKEACLTQSATSVLAEMKMKIEQAFQLT